MEDQGIYPGDIFPLTYLPVSTIKDVSRKKHAYPQGSMKTVMKGSKQMPTL